MVDANFEEYSFENASFHYQDVLPFEGKEQESLTWITQIIDAHQYELSALNYIFCTDEQLHKINLEHLDHDTYTDIITFDYSEEDLMLEGDIYISLDRVKDNAAQLGQSFDEELHRVLIHGVLHLLGYKDKTAEEKRGMRKKENTCLSLR
jgi:rRNA maturation RNase YbeY